MKTNMEKKELFITVAGKTATGKSRIVYKLIEFLREQNFEVELNNTDPTFNDNDDIALNIDNAIEHLSKTVKISIGETQLACSIKENKTIKRSDDIRSAGLIFSNEAMCYVGRYDDNLDFNISIVEVNTCSDKEWEKVIYGLKEELKYRRSK